ncbi:MAG: hypothetical protein K2L64_02035 [Ureaplasma sp.]|nr:hypothetical protein [Ureaplasma sp.]
MNNNLEQNNQSAINDTNSDNLLYSEAKKMKTTSIVSIVLIITLIGIIVSFIFMIINGIKILSTNWKYKQLEDNKILWGVLTFVVLGTIASLVFSCMALKELESQKNSNY